MPYYKVTKAFNDKSSEKRYAAGDLYQTNDADRHAFLHNAGFVEKKESPGPAKGVLSGSVDEINEAIANLSETELTELREEEQNGRNRKGVLSSIDKLLKSFADDAE